MTVNSVIEKKQYPIYVFIYMYIDTTIKKIFRVQHINFFCHNVVTSLVTNFHMMTIKIREDLYKVPYSFV